MSDLQPTVPETAPETPNPQWTQDHVASCLRAVRRALAQLGLSARGIDIHDAEDLTMELLMKLLALPDGFERLRSVTWLMRVARHLIIDKLRGVAAVHRAMNAGKHARAFRCETVTDDAALVSDERSDKETILKQVTAHFSKRESELFQLDWQQGGHAHTGSVAAELRIAPASVHVLRHRYKGKVKQALAGVGGM